MELRPHDIVRIHNVKKIVFDSKVPEWMDESLRQAPYLVVRRSPFIGDMVYVGARGFDRTQRLAGFVSQKSIMQQITPDKLAADKGWKTSERLRGTAMSHALDFVDGVVARHGFRWGPTGSVGFELASGTAVVNKNSDLDIVIRAMQFVSKDAIKQLETELEQSPVKVDALIETPFGAVALSEYARGDNPVLLRTINGPCLVHNPWI